MGNCWEREFRYEDAPPGEKAVTTDWTDSNNNDSTAAENDLMSDLITHVAIFFLWRYDVSYFILI